MEHAKWYSLGLLPSCQNMSGKIPGQAAGYEQILKIVIKESILLGSLGSVRHS